MRCWFDADPKVSVKTLRTKREEEGLLVFLSVDGPTPFTKREANDPWGEAVQFFSLRDAINNVSRHRLVPTHSLLDKGEEAALQRRLALREDQWPKLLMDDPQRRYHDFPRGTIVKQTFDGLAAERMVYYRRVCAA